jgi:hypothetical protein
MTFSGRSNRDGGRLDLRLERLQRGAPPTAPRARWRAAAWRSGPRAGLRPQGRASSTMLKGVSVALRTLPNPPCVIADESLAKPACAPSAAPTG